jgi:hypothetical protein
MSDSILVRVRLGHFDYARPAAQQTQVTVQVPEVARVSYLLDHRQYGVLREQPWPAVLEAAEREYVSRGVVSDPVSAAARKAVCEWLAVDEHHDALYEAWVADCARRDPVARRLLADLDLAKAETAALQHRVEELLVERHSTNESLSKAAEALRVQRDRIAELEAEPLAWAWKLDAKSLDNFLIALSSATEHEPMSEAIDKIHELLRSYSGATSVDGITWLLAPTQALRDGEHYATLHHAYRVGRDLPETGGVQ